MNIILFIAAISQWPQHKSRWSAVSSHYGALQNAYKHRCALKEGNPITAAPINVRFVCSDKRPGITLKHHTAKVQLHGTDRNHPWDRTSGFGIKQKKRKKILYFATKISSKLIYSNKRASNPFVSYAFMLLIKEITLTQKDTNLWKTRIYWKYNTQNCVSVS